MSCPGEIRRHVALVGLALLSACSQPTLDGPYQATGFKVGEVTATEAIVWTRLTRAPKRVGPGAPVPEFRYRDPGSDQLIEGPESTPVLVNKYGDWESVVTYPAGATIDTLEGAVPGARGEIRVQFRPVGQKSWQSTAWSAVDPEKDFTRQFRLTGLSPATTYELNVEARASLHKTVTSTLDGRFRTAPLAQDAAKVLFTVVTGQEYVDRDAGDDGYKIYPSMLALEPSFFVHTGDIVYYDHWAKSLALARWGWARMYSLPTNVAFHRRVSSYFIKDDHDTWLNDVWPGREARIMGNFTFEQGQAVFLEQVPMGDTTYRTFRWGKDLQIWLVEGRDFRSANTDPDGPDKTIWGAEQLAWFKDTVQASDATFRILISPTPLVGPDQDDKSDNHANDAFAYEGQMLRKFIAQQDNMLVICGDRHWQYISVDDETGIREYSTGPASDEHAGGWDSDDYRPAHRYLHVVGGFLAVTAARRDGTPTLLLQHYGVNGEILNEDLLAAQ